MPIVIKSPADIEKMRHSGSVVASVHQQLQEVIEPGVTTAELDRVAREMIENACGIPSFLNYNGFPSSICASIGNVIVHGIPDDRKLKDGEIISVDVGAYVDGFHGDAAATYAVGSISDDLQRLIEITERCFWVGLEQARAGNRVGDISAAVQNLAESNGYGIIKFYGGHGIGRKMHEDPSVLNHGESGTGARLQPGMTIAIEPMLSIGDPATIELEDGWTVATQDGSASAHYEHTVLITNDEPEILTAKR